MKAPATTLGFLIFTPFVFTDSAAQKASYTTIGGCTIGLGAGRYGSRATFHNRKNLHGEMDDSQLKRGNPILFFIN